MTGRQGHNAIPGQQGFQRVSGSAPECGLEVHAEMSSDDEQVRFNTDVAQWMSAATDEQILELARCGFGGDFPADEVAYGLESEQPAIASMLRHARSNDTGFEVHVDQDEALSWVAQHRPHLMSRIVGLDFDEASDAMLSCALWSSTDDDQENLDDRFGVGDFSDDNLAGVKAEFAGFLLANSDDIAASGLAPEQIGHDFWLTRNHHGTGFWDRGLGDVGKRLTDAAHVYGEAYVFVGDDGQPVIYS